MKRIIITAILAAICTVGGATSFVMNDLQAILHGNKIMHNNLRKRQNTMV